MAGIAISHQILFCACVVHTNNGTYFIGNNEAPFTTAVGNEELMHECFRKHSRMLTAIMKLRQRRRRRLVERREYRKK